MCFLISGQRSGKFQPKPKARMDREKRDAGSTSHPDGGESAHCSQNAQSIPSESEYINEGSISAYPLDDVLESPSLRLDDSTSGVPQNEEPSNLVETYFSDALNLEEHPKAVPESLEKVTYPTSTVMHLFLMEVITSQIDTFLFHIFFFCFYYFLN